MVILKGKLFTVVSTSIPFINRTSPWFDPWIRKISLQEEMATNLLQHPCQDNPMDRGAWRATIHGVAKSWTWLSNWVCMHSQHPSQPTPGPYSPIWDPYSAPWLCLKPGWGWSLHLNKGPHAWMFEMRDTDGSAIIPSYLVSKIVFINQKCNSAKQDEFQEMQTYSDRKTLQ